MIADLVKPFTSHRFLLEQLTQREIKARYKQSFVGYAWVLLNPLSQLLVYSFVFSVVFRFPTANIPYPIFLFSALLPWTLFQNAISSATQSLVVNASLLKKIAFPREIIPYSVVFSKLVDFFFSALVFVESSPFPMSTALTKVFSALALRTEKYPPAKDAKRIASITKKIASVFTDPV